MRKIRRILFLMLAWNTISGSFTYRDASPSLDWSFASEANFFPDLIVSFQSAKKILLVSPANSFAVVAVDSLGALSVERHPSNSKYSMSITNKQCGDAAEIKDTNFFLFASNNQATSIIKLDVTSPSTSLNEHFGLCADLMPCSRLLAIDEACLVTGKLLVIRSVLTGLILSRAGVASTNKLVRGEASTKDFFSLSSKETSLTLNTAAISELPVILTVREFNSFGGMAITGFAAVHQTGQLFACSAHSCYGINYRTGEVLWTESATNYFANAVSATSNQPLSLIILIDSPSSSAIKLYQSTSVEENLESLAQLSTPYLVKKASALYDGSYAVALSSERVRLYPKQLVCGSSCLTCIPASEECASCPAGYSLSGTVPQTCIAFSCDTTCLTCSGPEPDDCLSCDEDFLTFASATSTCVAVAAPDTNPGPADNEGDPMTSEGTTPTQAETPPSGPIDAEYCRNSLQPVSRSEPLECIACFNSEQFQIRRDECGSGSLVRYASWTVSTRWVSQRSFENLELTFALEDPVPQFHHPLSSLGPVLERKNFLVFLNESAVKISGIQGSRAQVQVPKAFMSHHSKSSLSISVANSDDLEKNILWSNITHFVVLVKDKLVSRVPPADHRDLQLTQTVMQAVQQAGKILRYAMLIGSFSFMLVPAISKRPAYQSFLRLIQISDLLSKFYLLPIDLSPISDFFLRQLYEATRAIRVDEEAVFKKAKVQANPFRYKLSSLLESQEVLVSIPVQAIGYPTLMLVHKLVSLMSRKLRRFGLVAGALRRIAWYYLQLNLVQFMFYSSVGLSRSRQDASFRSLCNLLLSLGLTVNCSAFLSEVFGCALRSLGTKKRPLSKKAASQVSHLILEGLSDGSAQRTRVRLLNVASTSRCFVFPVVVAALQGAPTFCLSALVLIQLAVFGEFIYLSLVCSPFESCLHAIKRWSCELTISSMLLGISCRKLDYYSEGIDYLSIVLFGCTFLAHVVGVGSDILHALWKKKPAASRRVTFDAKGKVLQSNLTKRTTATRSSQVHPLSMNSLVHSMTLPLSQKFSFQKKISIIGNFASVEDRQILECKLKKLKPDPEKEKEQSPVSKGSSKHSLIPTGNRVRKISMQKVQAVQEDKSQPQSNSKFFKQIWIKREPKVIAPFPAGE